MFCYRGCTRGTVTFFRYDIEQKQLIAIRIIRCSELGIPMSLITCLHVSQDNLSRHLAVATFSYEVCYLKVLRFEDPIEHSHNEQDNNQNSLIIRYVETLTDFYKQKNLNNCMRWIIKVCT